MRRLTHDEYLTLRADLTKAWNREHQKIHDSGEHAMLRSMASNQLRRDYETVLDLLNENRPA